MAVSIAEAKVYHSELTQQVEELEIKNETLTTSLETKEKKIIQLQEENATLEQQSITLASAQAEERTYLGQFELTFYCLSGNTATGYPVMDGVTVAVDPNVIPLHSALYIDGFGVRLAHDTGGVIKGNIIDVYVPDYETAIKLGRKKNVDVWMIN